MTSHAFLYEKGKMVDIGTLDGTPGGSSFALSINAAGQITGGSFLQGTGFPHAFVYRDGKMIDLNKVIDPATPLPGQAILLLASSISNNGMIVARGLDPDHVRAILLRPLR